MYRAHQAARDGARRIVIGQETEVRTREYQCRYAFLVIRGGESADMSVDVWFGPTAPKGHEANWVQTVPGEGWNSLLRLYDPEQAWFDKTWKPGDFELVE